MKYIDLLEEEMGCTDYLYCRKIIDWLRVKGVISFDCVQMNSCSRCNRKMKKALNKEFVRVIQVTRLEYELMKHFIKHGYYFGVRNKRNEFFIYEDQLTKQDGTLIYHSYELVLSNDLFSFIQWENSEDNKDIDFREIIKNCEVIDDE